MAHDFEAVFATIANRVTHKPRRSSRQEQILAAMADWHTTTHLAVKLGMNRNTLKGRLDLLHKKGVIEARRRGAGSIPMEWRAVSPDTPTVRRPLSPAGRQKHDP